MTRITPVASPKVRRGIRPMITAALVGSALLATVACGGDSGTGPKNKNVAGLYALATVNKKAFPIQIYRGQYTYGGYVYNDMTLTVTGGELILQDNGSFHVAVDLKYAANGGEASSTRSIDGQYQVRGGQITLTAGGGGSTTGTFDQGYAWVNLDPGQTGAPQTYIFKYTP